MSSPIIVFIGVALGCASLLIPRGRLLAASIGAACIGSAAWLFPVTEDHFVYLSMLSGLTLSLGWAQGARYVLAALTSVLTGLVLTGSVTAAAETGAGLLGPVHFGATALGTFAAALWVDALTGEKAHEDVMALGAVVSLGVIFASVMSADAAGMALHLPLVDAEGAQVAGVAGNWTDEGSLVGARDASAALTLGWWPVILLLPGVLVFLALRGGVLSERVGRSVAVVASALAFGVVLIAWNTSAGLDPAQWAEIAQPRLGAPTARFGTWPPGPYQVDMTPLLALAASVIFCLSPWFSQGNSPRMTSAPTPRVLLVFSVAGFALAATAVEWVRWTSGDVGGWSGSGHGVWIVALPAAFASTTLGWSGDPRLRLALTMLPITLLAFMVVRPELWL